MITTTCATHRRETRAERATRQSPALIINIGEHGEGADLTLGTTTCGPWAAPLGPFELPDERALDALAAAAESWESPPEQVTLRGAPATCLLPLLWLRTIWLGPEARIEIEWGGVTAPGPDGRETLAAQLCAALASGVRCDDASAAEELWGITTGESRPIDAGVMDLAIGLIDLWDIRQRGGPITDPAEWHIRARAAMEECRDAGRTPIALYGAGTHTRALGPLLMSPPVEVACIVDDDASRQGQRLWGFPIVSRSDAIRLGVKCVILSANVHEPRLAEHAHEFARAGVHVVRLYDDVFGAAERAAGASRWDVRRGVIASAEAKPTRGKPANAGETRAKRKR